MFVRDQSVELHCAMSHILLLLLPSLSACSKPNVRAEWRKWFAWCERAHPVLISCLPFVIQIQKQPSVDSQEGWSCAQAAREDYHALALGLWRSRTLFWFHHIVPHLCVYCSSVCIFIIFTTRSETAVFAMKGTKSCRGECLHFNLSHAHTHTPTHKNLQRPCRLLR